METERIDELQKKEDEKAKAVLNMLGLSNASQVLLYSGKE